MDPEGVRRLVDKGEGTTLDFKLDLREDSFREFSKDLAAFSNAEGGQILVGVTNSKEIVGVEWNSDKSARVNLEGSRCNPKIQPSIATVDVPKIGAVVVITIPKSGNVHQDVNGRYPLRVGDTTVNMDFALLQAVAKGKGLLPSEEIGPLQLPSASIPSSPKRRNPDKLRFLLDYMGSQSPVVREEALKELSRYTYRYKTELLPGFEDKIFGMLDDPKATVRIQVLHQAATTWSTLGARRKKRFGDKLVPKLISMVKTDSDFSVRGRAIYLLCEMGSEQAMGVIIDLLCNEPGTTFPQLGVTNGFRELVKKQSSSVLERRLFEEMSKQNSPEIQARFQKAVDDFRNTTWND
ncbi:MAG: putative DNA binding domain-containing protein [Nitrososphaerota archaeon]|nr:putative DNA binding domain-containing protein [Nitrososphaerota archaeon]